MLPTLQDLYPWLVALWLMECVILVRPLHLVAVSRLGRRFTLEGAGLRLAGALPFSRSFLTHRAFIGLLPEGVMVLTNPVPTEGARYDRESFTILPYEALGGPAVEGSTIRWSDSHETRLPSVAFASVIVERVRELVALPPKQRAKKIAAFDTEAFDVDAAIRLREELSIPVARLQWACTSVFLLVLVLFPVLMYSELATYRWLALWALVLLLAQLAVSVFGYRFNREMEERDLHVNKGNLPWLSLYPPAAAHAANSLGRDLYQRLDHLTVAAATLSRRQLIRLLRSELYGIRHAKSTSDEKTWLDWCERRRRKIEGLIQHQELSEEDVLAAPERIDPVAARFCPLCHMEYLDRAESCTDCRFELVELAVEADA